VGPYIVDQVHVCVVLDQRAGHVLLAEARDVEQRRVLALEVHIPQNTESSSGAVRLQ
jgi:hypothetical protein